MTTRIGRNERSWVIDLISKINEFVSLNNLSIKKAGGENTISSKGKTMFPDVLLYGDVEQSLILQGWEAKMPDVPINNIEFIYDAQRKARALNLNSCVLWNFTYVQLYIIDEYTDEFRLFKTWNDTSFIKTRADVERYRSEWEELLNKVILELNQLFQFGTIRESSLGEALSNNVISLLIKRNKDIVARYLWDKNISDVRIGAYIDNWWSNTSIEYIYDEEDKYRAYAKNTILNWANRIIFAHIIKKWQNPAAEIENIDENTSPEEANNIFANITSQCDFFNIFSSVRYDILLPSSTWRDFVELSLFLKNNGTDFINQSVLQNVLENTVNSTKREINGQYSTPVELAKLLVFLTVKNWKDDILDPCCGTGTIVREALLAKKEKIHINKAVETVWAADKNRFPLQVANISMAGPDTIYMPNRIFQHNALSLNLNEVIKIKNPIDGKDMNLKLPEFGSIVSNLPFVPFEIIPEDDKVLMTSVPFSSELDKRSDLYSYIILAMHKLLKPNGKLGIITSNSWLGTISGDIFVEIVQKLFNINQIHISGKGRWFNNADVVTTIMILEKKSNLQNSNTSFYLWKKSLEDFEFNHKWEEKLINSALLEKELDPDVVKVSKYNYDEIQALKHLELSYNALFHNVKWLLDIADKTVQINEVFDVKRGSRRGWDAMFYPAIGHSIEKQYLRKVLVNARNVTRLIAHADSDAFCCCKTIEELQAEGSNGTIAWISQFERQVNGVGKPLPLVLAKKGMQWYELQDKEIVDIFTTMNPDKRLFFARFDKPSFINQRLIGLKAKVGYEDIEFEHALLNSVFTMFYIEASGFGRGLGVLDINSKNIAKCRMLNPKLVPSDLRNNIVEAFKPLLNREIKSVKEELSSLDRMVFEKTVMKAFGIEECLASIVYSLLSMQNTRQGVNNSVEPFDSNSEFGYNKIARVAESAIPYN